MKNIFDNHSLWKVHYHHIGIGDDCVAYIRGFTDIDVFNKLLENERCYNIFIDSIIKL